MISKTSHHEASNFLITIHHQENHSWQGVIEWLDSGKKMHFRSELELIMLMQNAIQIHQLEKNHFRSWDDARKMSIV